MIRRILYAILAASALAAFTGCDEGILPTEQYKNDLPSVNFVEKVSSVEETSATPVDIAVTIYNGPSTSGGKFRVKVTPAVGTSYGTDFTTSPSVVDGYIDIALPAGEQGVSIRITAKNDLKSLADKKVNFALCDWSGGVMVGGKYSHDLTIKNMNNTVEGLIITPSVAAMSDFGKVDNGAQSAPAKFTLACTGLTQSVTVTAPANFMLARSQAGPFSMGLEIPKADFAPGSPLDIWVVFAPATGLDGAKSGNIKILTEGTNGYSVAVSGTESGNSGPYTFMMGDLFWNASKSVIGNKTPMVWSTGADGDIYYYIDLTSFAKPTSQLGTIEFMLWANADQTCTFTAYDTDFASLVQGSSVKPVKNGAIASLEDRSVTFTGGQFTTIDMTAFIKSRLDAGTKQVGFIMTKKSGADLQVISSNKSSAQDQKPRLVINDK